MIIRTSLASNTSRSSRASAMRANVSRFSSRIFLAFSYPSEMKRLTSRSILIAVSSL